MNRERIRGKEPMLMGHHCRSFLHIVLATGLFLCSGTTPVQAQTAAVPVARVLDIDGTRLLTNRRSADRWFQAYPGMKGYLTERLRTDQDTLAVLQFAIGGEAGLGRNTEVEIIGQRALETIGNKIVVKSGQMWAKMDKQKKQLQIQTGGGVIGIEGTEFLVSVDEETGVTELLLFEGQVSITENSGKKTTLAPGDYAEFGGSGGGMCVLSYPSGGLRSLVVERFPEFSSFLAARGVTTIPPDAPPSMLRSHLPAVTGLDELLEISADGLVADPTQFDSGADRVTGLAPAYGEVVSRPVFHWNAVPGAVSYQLIVGTDAGMDDIVFSSSTSNTNLDIPAGAPDGEPGTYFYRVIPLDAEGRPMAKASQTSFQSSGWTSEGVVLESEATAAKSP